MSTPAYRPDDFSIPKILWWIIAMLVAAIFSIFTWAGCFYLFNFPEKPGNYRFLNKIGFVGDIERFTPLTAPTAREASPQYLFEAFYDLPADQKAQINNTLIRGYITNYDKIPVFRYLSGEFRIISVRPLKQTDLLYPGLLVKARAFIKSGENELSSPYPLYIDYLIPTAAQGAQHYFQEGDLMTLEKAKHCATLLHATMEGATEDPTLRCTVVPLAYNIYRTPDRQEIPLSPPQLITLTAPLPTPTQPPVAVADPAPTDNSVEE